MILYALVSFMGHGGGVLRVILAVLGILCVLGFVFLLGIGVVLLFRKEPAPGVVFDSQSGEKDGVVPGDIKGWNWGAAMLGSIWGVYHGVWLSLLTFIPLFNFAWMIVMGVKGNEWAWRKRKWLGVQHFNDSQWAWKRMGLVFFMYFIFVIVVEGAMFAASFAGLLGMRPNSFDDKYMKDSQNYNYTFDKYGADTSTFDFSQYDDTGIPDTK